MATATSVRLHNAEQRIFEKVSWGNNEQRRYRSPGQKNRAVLCHEQRRLDNYDNESCGVLLQTRTQPQGPLFLDVEEEQDHCCAVRRHRSQVEVYKCLLPRLKIRISPPVSFGPTKLSKLTNPEMTEKMMPDIQAEEVSESDRKLARMNERRRDRYREDANSVNERRRNRYREDPDSLNERRRNRYREDPNYRELIKERDRKYQAKKRQERQPIILAAESTTSLSAEPTETPSADTHKTKFEEHEERRKRVRETQSQNHNEVHNERRWRKYREDSSYRELAKERDRKYRARKKLERQSTLPSIESTDAPGTPATSQRDVMAIAFITE
jgi:hypothetical protein